MKLPDAECPLEAQPEDVLLAMCLFGEARGQCDEARLGVANVVRNRLADPQRRYGAGWGAVLLQPCQFACFRPGDPNRPKLRRPLEHEAPLIWARCWEIARRVYEGLEADNTQGATHYFDDTLLANPPRWARRCTPTVKIGALNFFRAPAPEGRDG